MITSLRSIRRGIIRANALAHIPAARMERLDPRLCSLENFLLALDVLRGMYKARPYLDLEPAPRFWSEVREEVRFGHLKFPIQSIVLAVEYQCARTRADQRPEMFLEALRQPVRTLFRISR